MNDAQKQLRSAQWDAHFDPGCDPKPAVTVQINGIEFQIQYIVVNRKCYDFLPTPTVQFKMNGKRVSRAVAYESLA